MNKDNNDDLQELTAKLLQTEKTLNVVQEESSKYIKQLEERLALSQNKQRRLEDKCDRISQERDAFKNYYNKLNHIVNLLQGSFLNRLFNVFNPLRFPK